MKETVFSTSVQIAFARLYAIARGFKEMKDQDIYWEQSAYRNAALKFDRWTRRIPFLLFIGFLFTLAAVYVTVANRSAAPTTAATVMLIVTLLGVSVSYVGAFAVWLESNKLRSYFDSDFLSNYDAALQNFADAYRHRGQSSLSNVSSPEALAAVIEQDTSFEVFAFSAFISGAKFDTDARELTQRTNRKDCFLFLCVNLRLFFLSQDSGTPLLDDDTAQLTHQIEMHIAYSASPA